MPRACKRAAPDVIEMEASEADDDDDQTTAQDGQTSDDDSEETSGNAIKVTHDTPLGSKGNGADQLIKTFGILNAAAFGADFSPRSRFAQVPRGLADLRAGGELSNRIKLMLPVQSWPQKYFDSLRPKSPLYRSRSDPWRGVSRSSRTRGGMRWTRMALQTTAPKRTAKPCGPDAPTLASSW
jgi:hypothetical protein